MLFAVWTCSRCTWKRPMRSWPLGNIQSSRNDSHIHLTRSHHDLASFLKYAQQNRVSPQSTTYVGTLYEYGCQAALTRLGFQLIRSGGRSDAGVDLYGTWHVPSHPEPLRAIVQCKALSAKLGPSIVRELEGAFAGAPAGWNSDDTIGVLCARKEATKGVRDTLRRSQRGLIWILVDDQPLEDSRTRVPGKIRQIVWNQRVAEIAAEGLEVGIVHSTQDGHMTEPEKEVRLMWEGKIWQPALNGALQQEDRA